MQPAGHGDCDSSPGQAIYDPILGSGTTLIAAGAGLSAAASLRGVAEVAVLLAAAAPPGAGVQPAILNHLQKANARHQPHTPEDALSSPAGGEWRHRLVEGRRCFFPPTMDFSPPGRKMPTTLG